jgi:hypothetical protein
MRLPPITTPDGRRAWAFAAIVGGAIVMTIFAGYGVYLVRESKGMILWLALAAHGQIVICLTGLIALFVKRSVKVSKDSIEISDQGEAP